MAQLRKSSNLSPQLMEVREPWQNSCWPVGTSGLFGTKARRDSRFHVKVSQSSTNKHDLCNTSIWSLPVAKISDSLGTWPDFCVWQLELCNFQSELLLFILKVYHRDTYIFSLLNIYLSLTYVYVFMWVYALCVCVYVRARCACVQLPTEIRGRHWVLWKSSENPSPLSDLSSRN